MRTSMVENGREHVENIQGFGQTSAIKSMELLQVPAGAMSCIHLKFGTLKGKLFAISRS